MIWWVWLFLVGHPHPDPYPLNSFQGLKGVSLEAENCRKQFEKEIRARGLILGSDQGFGVDELVVLSTVSPSGDWLLSIYLIRPGLVGFPRQQQSKVATWWHHSMFDGKPKAKECRFLANMFGEAYGNSVKSTA